MTKTFITRTELVAQLIRRDGLACQHPEHDHMLSLDTPEGPLQITLDHIEPQSWCKEQGWTDEQVWDLNNLALMCKKGNADKGSRRYLPDGTLEPKPMSRFRYRRAKKAQKPEVCTECTAGRDLGPDEVCAACGSGPMPHRFPRWAKVPSNECDHELFWCWLCSSGLTERAGATEMILLHGEGGEGSTLPVDDARVHNNG